MSTRSVNKNSLSEQKSEIFMAFLLLLELIHYISMASTYQIEHPLTWLKYFHSIYFQTTSRTQSKPHLTSSVVWSRGGLGPHDLGVGRALQLLSQRPDLPVSTASAGGRGTFLTNRLPGQKRGQKCAPTCWKPKRWASWRQVRHVSADFHSLLCSWNWNMLRWGTYKIRKALSRNIWRC